MQKSPTYVSYLVSKATSPLKPVPFTDDQLGSTLQYESPSDAANKGLSASNTIAEKGGLRLGATDDENTHRSMSEQISLFDRAKGD